MDEREGAVAFIKPATPKNSPRRTAAGPTPCENVKHSAAGCSDTVKQIIDNSDNAVSDCLKLTSDIKTDIGDAKDDTKNDGETEQVR